MTMSPQTESVSNIFQTSRRRSHGLLVGILVVLGYFCGAAVMIRDYSVVPSSVDQIA